MIKSEARGRLTVAQRLLAEAVRYDEAGTGVPAASEEAVALSHARKTNGTLEAKVVARAEALPSAARITREIDRMRSLFRGIIVAGVVIAGAAGAATARTAFSSPDGTTVNFFWLLASILGLHLFSFLIWLAVMVAAPNRSQGGLLGSAVFWLWRQAAERFGAGRYRAAAVQALGSVWGRGRIGRWLMSGVSHGVWTGFLLGAVLMAFALLSAQRYNFVWETTILNASAYIRITAFLSALPATLGFATPGRDAVLAAEWPGAAQAGDEGLWSSLLIATLVLYGLAPRLIALLVSLALARRAAANITLDLSRPRYARLVPLLSPVVTTTRIVDAATTAQPMQAVANVKHSLPPSPNGPVFLLGWEIDVPACGWPPPAAATMQAHDLGRQDSRNGLQRAIATIDATGGRPGRVVAVVDLRQTPDRGVTAALTELRCATGDRLVLLLTGDAALHHRLSAEDASDRIADWVSAGHAAGVGPDRLVAIDLDDISETTQRQLLQLLGGNP